jgi:hypothetical protein
VRGGGGGGGGCVVSPTSGGSASIGAIVGGVVGGVAALALIVGAVVLRRRRAAAAAAPRVLPAAYAAPADAHLRAAGVARVLAPPPEQSEDPVPPQHYDPSALEVMSKRPRYLGVGRFDLTKPYSQPLPSPSG